MHGTMVGRLRRVWLLVGLFAASAVALAQEGFGKLDPTPPTGKTPEEIVQAMGAKETQFAQARDNYVFRQSVRFQTINDDNGKVDGEYYQVSDVGFDKSGARTETVTFAPQNTIERLILEQRDFDDLQHRLPFVLQTKDLPDYNVTYVGRQQVDELATYVFDVEPKVIEKNRRYFKGKVWVDQQDLQIVLVSGKNVPDDLRRGHESLSPPFTTYYEQVDGKYWFPTYTKAEGTLHFPGGNGAMAQDVHTRSIVKYTDYRRYRSTARIIVDGKDITDQAEPEKPEPKK